MGKYIIDLPDNTQWVEWVISDGRTASMDFLNVEDLEEYTEPDVEKIVYEALDDGYKNGYGAGINDAWDAARKVGHCKLWGDYTKDTGKTSVCAVDVLDHYCASEAIEKLKANEERDAIRVGDIVRMKSAPEIEIWVTDISDENGGRLSGLALKSVGDNCEIGDTYAYMEIRQFERTGRHCDVATVLEKMREKTD